MSKKSPENRVSLKPEMSDIEESPRAEEMQAETATSAKNRREGQTGSNKKAAMAKTTSNRSLEKIEEVDDASPRKPGAKKTQALVNGNPAQEEAEEGGGKRTSNATTNASKKQGLKTSQANNKTSNNSEGGGGGIGATNSNSNPPAGNVNGEVGGGLKKNSDPGGTHTPEGPSTPNKDGYGTAGGGSSSSSGSGGGGRVNGNSNRKDSPPARQAAAAPGGSQTSREAYPATTNKPAWAAAHAKGSVTSRQPDHGGGSGGGGGGASGTTGTNTSNSYNYHNNNYAKPGDAFTMSAGEWRARGDIQTWRKHTPDETGGSPQQSQSLGRGSVDGGSLREGMSSRGDESLPGDEDTGRRFTKKGSRGSNFGSSTTLSSATEASDENDDNFHVVLRVRPLSTQEKQRRDHFAASFPGDGKCAVENNGSQRGFQFNVVFEPDATQEDVFENCGIKRLVDNAVSGYTCTAFAFGQTGSGKTHTMTGPPAQFHQVGVTPDPKMYGIIQRSFKYMYQQIKQQGGGKIIRASYLEIYNEQVIDLLNNSHRRYLSVRWSKNKGFYVENLFTVECETLDDLMAVLEEGLRNRQTGSHGLNEFSSRSHSVLTVTIDSETQPDTEDENLYVTKRGKLSFVDLAGSEKVKDASGSFGGPGMLESNSINKSLLVLGNCISHLGDAKRRQGHIPYRDSKLTKLLSDSLGGHGITLMIACITPSSSNITETMNTLRYASRAKKIKTKPTVKMDPREKLILSLKREIKVLRNENHYLRQQLEFPAKPKGQLQKENDEKFMKFMKEQKEKESGLYEMLQEYMVENEALRAENSEMHSTRDKIRREQQLLYRENEKLMKRLEDMEKVVSQNPAMWATAQHKRTDGYGQYDLISPRGSPIGPGYHSGHSQKGHPPLAGSPPGSRGKGPPGPMKPPHRLPDPVMRPAQRPIEVVENGATYPNNGYTSPRAGPRQTSPTRQMERKASQLSTTDAIHSMNEQLKREVMQLEGQIRHHQYVAERSGEMSRVHGSSVR